MIGPSGPLAGSIGINAAQNNKLMILADGVRIVIEYRGTGYNFLDSTFWSRTKRTFSVLPKILTPSIYHLLCVCVPQPLGFGFISCVVDEWVSALDWRPGGPGFESCCGNFGSELWQFRLPRLIASVFPRRH